MVKNIGQDFNDTPPPAIEKPDRLYHATVYDIGSGPIMPRRNWTSTRGEYGAFVFAGSDRPVAHAYAMKTRDCISAGRLSGHDGQLAEPFVLIGNRADFYRAPPAGTIHLVDPADFSPVLTRDGQAITGEWIARHAVYPLESLRAGSVEENMQRGVQLFFLNRNPDTEEQTILRGEPDMNAIGTLIRNGLLLWENHAQNIGASHKLNQAVNHSPAPADRTP